jgi:hypothetical protein
VADAASGDDREPEPAPERTPGERRLGLREALLVGELVVVVVLLAGVVTYLLPGDARDVVLRTPLLILVLVGGTAGVLWRISRPGRIDR